jgi:hypothetical protein
MAALAVQEEAAAPLAWAAASVLAVPGEWAATLGSEAVQDTRVRQVRQEAAERARRAFRAVRRWVSVVL